MEQRTEYVRKARKGGVPANSNIGEEYSSGLSDIGSARRAEGSEVTTFQMVGLF